MREDEALKQLKPEHALIVKQMINQEVTNEVEKQIDDKFKKTEDALKAIDEKTVKIWKLLAGDEFTRSEGLIKEHIEMYTWFKQMKWISTFLGITSITSIISMILALNSVFHWF